MIDYKQITDKLQQCLPNDNNLRFWTIELLESYIEGNKVIVIYLLDCGCDNKYRLYHSELNSGVTNDKELMECCLSELREVYNDIKMVASYVLNSGYVLCEMEDKR